MATALQVRNVMLSLFTFTCLFLGNTFLIAAEKERAPVVFAHGIIVPSSIYTDVVPLKKVFQEHGYTVHVAVRPSGLTLVQRAEVLKSEIERLVPTGKFHLVGHSAGGLDGRYALWKYKDLAARCLSLTTMATPHLGSPVADDIIANAEDGKFDLSGAFFGYLFGQIEGSRQLAYELTTEHAKQFNLYVLNDERVRYFSMGFYIEQPYYKYARPLAWKNHVKLLNLGYTFNDGPVPLEHSRWGEPLPDMVGDHFAETSQIKYDNREIYRENFAKLLENLDKNF